MNRRVNSRGIVIPIINVKIYKEWKKQRLEMIESLLPQIIKLSENEQMALYDVWENDIIDVHNRISEDASVHNLTVLSILHYCQRDSSVFRGLLSSLFDCLLSSNRELFKIAVNVLFTAAKENPTNLTLIYSPLINALNWIREKVPDLLYSGLYFVKKALSFPELEVVSRLIPYFDILYQILLTKDQECIKLSHKIMYFVLKTISLQTNSVLVTNYFHDSLRLISMSKNIDVLGPLMLSRSYYELYPHFFNSEKNRLTTALISLCENEDLEVSIEAFKFSLLVGRNQANSFSSLQIEHLYSVLYYMLSLSGNLSHYSSIMSDFIRVFSNCLEIESMATIMEDIHDEIEDEETFNIFFEIISTVLEYIPNSKAFNSLFFTGPICDNEIKCLGLLQSIDSELSIKICKFIKDNIVFTLNNDNILKSLKLIRLFDDLVFDYPQDLYKVVIPIYYNTQDEQIACEIVKIVGMFDIHEADEFLINCCLYGQFRSSRIEALSLIKPSESVAISSQISQVLTDSSIKVRQKGVQLISKLFSFNPLDFYSCIVESFYDVISCIKMTKSYKKSSSFSSLLPIYLNLFEPVLRQFIPQIIRFCIEAICGSIKKIERSNTGYAQKVLPPSEFPEGFHQIDSLSQPLNTLSHMGKESRLFYIYNQKYIDLRDSFLLQSLAECQEHLFFYFDYVLFAFNHVFTTRTDFNLLKVAAESLCRIVSKIGSGINLSLYSPDIVSSLSNLLRTSYPQETIVAILHLLGTSVDSFGIQRGDTKSPELSIDPTNPSYFTDFVFSHLVPYFSSPQIEMLRTVIQIFECAPNEAAKFIHLVIPMFIKSIKTMGRRLLFLFSGLEVIVTKCKTECIPFLSEISSCLVSYLRFSSCIKLCTCLSITFKSSLKAFSNQLFIEAISLIKNTDYKTFIILLTFLSFSVIFQNHQFSLLLDALEACLPFLKENISFIAESFSKNMCQVLMHSDISLFHSRVMRIAIALFNSQKSNYHLQNLVFMAALSCKMQYEILKMIIPQCEKLDQYQNDTQYNIFDISKSNCVTLYPLNYDPFRINPPQETSTIFFDTIKAAPTGQSFQFWLNILCENVISASPSSVIRSCISFIEYERSFKEALFPVAFLSCWEVLSMEQKKRFSSIIYKMFFSQSKGNQTILQLAEIVDRAGMPFDIPYLELSKISTSKSLCLYFFQQHLKMIPGDVRVYEMLLHLNTTMGRMASAHGILSKLTGSLDKSSTARWNEYLRNWDKAIQLYDKYLDSLSNRIRCYAHLQQWEEIQKQESFFHLLSDSEKEYNAHHFAWAYYHQNDYSKVNQALSYFPQERSFGDVLFEAVYNLKIGRLNEVDHCINHGYSILAKDRTIFGGGDINKANQILENANLLVELEEILSLKQKCRNPNYKLCEGSTKRIKGFLRDSETFIRLIDIRGILYPIETNSSIYLKILSVLRSEGRYDLIDRYMNRMNSEMQKSVDFIKARAKILWSKGEKSAAISLLKESGPDSRIYRLLGTYLISTSTSNVFEALEYYQKSIQMNSSDINSWIGWAYANSIIVNPSDPDSDKYSINAVQGYLKVLEIGNSNAISFIIQMFSIFFKIKNSSLINKKLIDGIYGLPHNLFIQVIPQLTVQISHNDSTIRTIVHNLLSRFGDNHFQAIVFPLLMYTFSKQHIKCDIAKELLNKLKENHLIEYKDASLFVKGMLDAALTPFEEWILVLDEAAQAYKIRDMARLHQILEPQFDKSVQEKSDLDKRFMKMNGDIILRAKHLFLKNSAESKNEMWGYLKALYEKCLESTNRLEIILLQRVNEFLTVKRGYNLAIPGTYEIGKKPDTIESIDPCLQVLSTQQHPRILHLHSSSGEKVKFLLKGSKDLRLDQRVMQFFSLVNGLLKNSEMREKGASVVEYAIIPLSPTAGLIRWVTNADTLHQMITEQRALTGASPTPEFDVINSMTKGVFRQLNAIQKYEIFLQISEICPADEIKNFFWTHSPNADSWLSNVECFTITTAIMSMVGYVIGLCDRHPSNIMVQKDTGRIIHIDFGDTFEKTMHRATYPEKVPFRLTRMMINALDCGSVEGLFTKISRDTMKILRANKSSLVALLEIFIHEPIEESFSESSPLQSPTSIIARVSEKLTGKDMIDEYGKEMDESDQVKILIKEASDAMKYITHYDGWCPYW